MGNAVGSIKRLLSTSFGKGIRAIEPVKQETAPAAVNVAATPEQRADAARRRARRSGRRGLMTAGRLGGGGGQAGADKNTLGSA